MVVFPELSGLDTTTEILRTPSAPFDQRTRATGPGEERVLHEPVALVRWSNGADGVLRVRSSCRGQQLGGNRPGTAGLMMFISPRAAGGLHGQEPSITDLDERGDMHHHVDFVRCTARSSSSG